MSDDSPVRQRVIEAVGVLAQAHTDAEALLPAALAELDQARVAAQHNDAQRRAAIAAEFAAARAAYEATQESLRAQVDKLDTDLAPLGNAPWTHPSWQEWKPLPRGSDPPRVTRFGTVSQRLGDAELHAPLLVPIIGSGSVCVIAPDARKQAGIAAIQSAALRLLAGIPAGMLRLTVIDPLGLGANAANFVALRDSDEDLMTKAVTEPNRIEQQLEDMTQHVSNVIQANLRTDFNTIEEYNRSGGVRVDGATETIDIEAINPIAEPYRLVLVFDFPHNFSDDAARRLVSLVQKGARCGVYALIHLDPGRKLPHGFDAAELTNHCQVITQRDDGAFLIDSEPQTLRNLASCPIMLDSVPADLSRRIIDTIGKHSRSSQGVAVKFERISPSIEYWWRGSQIDGQWHGTGNGLRVALGPAGARKLQYLDVGRDSTKNHVLIAGKSGSGKSKLLHAIILNLSLTYSPDELELYLLDFKEGIEFKVYAERSAPLPHASVVAIESEREFGLSVLRRLQKELEDRGTKFKPEGAPASTNLGQYRDVTKQSMTRIMVVIDEFQVLFNDNDAIAGEASRIIDDLARRGRSFGVHLLLATQTLTGSGRLADSTLAQFGVRIALQCSDADSRKILADDNGAARLLRRSGEAIYNDKNGLVEGNSHFQAALLQDEQIRDYIAALHKRSGPRRNPQIVFEGSTPALLENNRLLQEAFTALPATTPPRRVSAWLGEPIEIMTPTLALFRRQRGSNLIVVGRDDKLALGMLVCSVISLAAQYDRTAAAFTIADFSDVDDDVGKYLEQLSDLLPHPVTYTRPRGLATSLQRIAVELAERQSRSEEGLRSRPSLFLVISGLHRARDLQPDGGDYGRTTQPSGALPTTEAKKRPRLSDSSPSPRDATSHGDTAESSSVHEVRSNPTLPTSQQSPAQLFLRIVRDGPEIGIHTIIWCDSHSNAQSVSRNLVNECDTRVALRMSDKDGYALLGVSGAEKLTNVRALLVNHGDGRLEKFRPYSSPPMKWIAQMFRKPDYVASS